MKIIKQSKDSLLLMERCPASCFEEAYPIGNGSQGAMIYGDPQSDIIGLNDDTLWSGYPRAEEFRGEKKEALDRAKKAVLDGDYIGAEKEISDNFGSYATDTYLPLGDMTVTIEKRAGKVRNYKRSLDLRRAVATVNYNCEGTTYSVTAFASHPDKTIVYRIDAQGRDGKPIPSIALNVGFRSQLYSKTYTESKLLIMEGECPVTSEQCRDWTERTVQYYDDPQKRGVRFMAIADIVTDGRKVDELNTICVKNASYCEIRIFMATSFNGYNKHPFTEGCDYRALCHNMHKALSDKSYSEILKAHIKDHSRFFNRMKLDLGSDNRSSIATSERLRRYEKGGADRALPALLFNFGKYLTVAASREGSQATNLQGIWNSRYMPPWQSNYTVNINTEMNYMPTLAMGLSEMYEPLIRLTKELARTGKITAEQMYGADGWCCHHNTDIWRHTQPVPVEGYPCCFFWNGAGGWLCHHLMEYYEYTLDKGFLEKTAYPVMRESVRFYLSQLVTMDGYRILLPSTSPENRFLDDDQKCSISETAEMTMAILRELFGSYLKVCDILNIDDGVTQTVRDELPRLLPIRISSDGRIMEWYREYPENEVKHRHLSHLYAFYPAHEFDIEEAPELYDACRKTLKVRGDGGMGWSLSWKSCLYARLMDGEKALSFVKKQLKLSTDTGFNNNNGGGVYTNMLCSGPPYQIDANFGTSAAIIEMLLQSDVGTMHLIPALPQEWSNIRVTNLWAKGNRSVSFEVRDGALTELVIKGDKPSCVLVAGEDISDRIIGENSRWSFKIDRQNLSV